MLTMTSFLSLVSLFLCVFFCTTCKWIYFAMPQRNFNGSSPHSTVPPSAEHVSLVSKKLAKDFGACLKFRSCDDSDVSIAVGSAASCAWRSLYVPFTRSLRLVHLISFLSSRRVARPQFYSRSCLFLLIRRRFLFLFTFLLPPSPSYHPTFRQLIKWEI